MARGNWRSGEGHGVAEVGSAQKVIDWPMKKSMSFPNREDAQTYAVRLRKEGYRCSVIKGRMKWNVWRTYRTMKNMQQIIPLHKQV